MGHTHRYELTIGSDRDSDSNIGNGNGNGNGTDGGGRISSASGNIIGSGKCCTNGNTYSIN